MFDKVNMTITRRGARPATVTGRGLAAGGGGILLFLFPSNIFSTLFFPKTFSTLPPVSVFKCFSERSEVCWLALHLQMHVSVCECVCECVCEWVCECVCGCVCECVWSWTRPACSYLSSSYRAFLTEQNKRKKERENHRSMCVCVSCSVTNKHTSACEIEKMRERQAFTIVRCVLWGFSFNFLFCSYRLCV